MRTLNGLIPGALSARLISVTLSALLISLSIVGCASEDNAPPASDDVIVAADSVSDADDQGTANTDQGTPDPDEGKVDPPDTTIIPPDTGPPPQPQDPLVCSGNVLEPLQQFGGSCCFTAGNHTQNPNCNEFGACIHAQCGSGYCQLPFCSKSCQLGKDQKINATGENGQDGISDEDGFNDCAGAVDGPVGNEFRCVNLNEPNGDVIARCFPGTTFAACDSNADCPSTEACTLMYIHDQYQTRCQIPPKDAALGTEPCTFDPAGPPAYCASDYCSGSAGCLDFCGTDADCLTDTCNAGKCVGSPELDCTDDVDCSAWACEERQPYSNNAFVTDMCFPKGCETASDCPGADWFCRPFWNGADSVELVATAHQCRPTPPGTAQYGEPCDENTPCAYEPACLDGYCAGPCKGDADCIGGTECLLGFEWNIDVDDDTNADTTVNIDVCQKWEHSGQGTPLDCTTNEDCAAGEVCQYRVKGAGDGDDRVWAAEFKCRTLPEENTGTFGETCGNSSTSGQGCKTDLCLIPNGLITNAQGQSIQADAYCVEYCNAAADCPDQMGPYHSIYWKTVCVSFNVNENNTPAPEDDAFVSFCRPTASTGSLADCSETRACAKPKEYCRALAIAGNPDVKVTVEHLCSDSGEGLAAYPTLELGEACTSGAQCKGRRCMPDGEGGGYCSVLCASNADCASQVTPGLVCTEDVLTPRADPALSGVTNRCVLQKTCMGCSDDSDCGGDYQCVNFGGIGFLADYRCGSPCETDGDCPDPDASCIEDVDPAGKISGKKVCGPSFCPDPEEEG